ncbi:hypothetical protein GCM10008933_01540 [Paenibacillus motobuensis]|uniref:Uncharacterized protein n=1 Tax=Paenibacillus motobuensis TaxID=295324 RepID=A0ABP3HMZ4_9BACL
MTRKPGDLPVSMTPLMTCEESGRCPLAAFTYYFSTHYPNTGVLCLIERNRAFSTFWQVGNAFYMSRMSSN